LCDGTYELGAHVRAASPSHRVSATLGGNILGEDQDKIIDDVYAIDVKSNTLGGNIGDEAEARLNTDPEFDSGEPPKAMTGSPASFINFKRTHAARLRISANTVYPEKHLLEGQLRAT
jgi:hypothetical protein